MFLGDGLGASRGEIFSRTRWFLSAERPVDPNTLRITNQFRSRDGMVYDMRGHGTHLTVVVTPSSNERDLGAWRVQARTHVADTPSIEEWGPTRIEAVRAVGRAWTEADRTPQAHAGVKRSNRTPEARNGLGCAAAPLARPATEVNQALGGTPG